MSHRVYKNDYKQLPTYIAQFWWFINMGLIEGMTKMIYLSISVVIDCFHFVLDPALWTQQYANDLVKVFFSIWILVLWSHQSTKVLHDDVNSLLMFGLTSQPSLLVWGSVSVAQLIRLIQSGPVSATPSLSLRSSHGNGIRLVYNNIAV